MARLLVLLLVLLLVITAVAKLVDVNGAMRDPHHVLYLVFSGVELGLACLLVAGRSRRIGASLAALAFSGMGALTLPDVGLHGAHRRCGCFGILGASDVWVRLLVQGVALLLAVGILAAGTRCSAQSKLAQETRQIHAG